MANKLSTAPQRHTMLFKLLLQTVLFSAFVIAQGFPARPGSFAPSAHGTLLNGSTQYWLKTTPVNLDMNGSELLSNPTLDAGVTNWGGGNGVTLSHETIVVRTGAGSAKGTSNGTASGFIRSTNTISGVDGKKYTAEAWVRVPAGNTLKTLRVLIAKVAGLQNIGYTEVTPANDTWTKIVVNATKATTEDITLVVVFQGTPASGDIFYVDGASLTEAYDFTFLQWFKTTGHVSHGSVYNSPMGKGDIGGTVTGGFGISYQSDNILKANIIDNNLGSIASLSSAVNVSDNTMRLVVVTVDRDGNAIIYINGTSIANVAVSVIGRITAGHLAIGTDAQAGTSRSIAGVVGATQIIRGTALSAADIKRIYLSSRQSRTGFPKAYAGGQVVFHTNWKAPGVDISGNGNHLTPTAGPVPVRVRY